MSNVRQVAKYLNIALVAKGGTSTRGELSRIVSAGTKWPLLRGEVTDALYYLRKRGLVELKLGDSDWLDSHSTIVVATGANTTC